MWGGSESNQSNTHLLPFAPNTLHILTDGRDENLNYLSHEILLMFTP